MVVLVLVIGCEGGVVVVVVVVVGIVVGVVVGQRGWAKYGYFPDPLPPPFLSLVCWCRWSASRASRVVMDAGTGAGLTESATTDDDPARSSPTTGILLLLLSVVAFAATPRRMPAAALTSGSPWWGWGWPPGGRRAG